MNIRLLQRIPHFIEHRFGLGMCLSALAGLFLPGLDLLPRHTAVVIIAIVTYFACFKVHLEDIGRLPWMRVFCFYIFRFIILPMAAYALLQGVFPGIALSTLLFFLLPAGLSMPAFAAIHEGNVALAMALAVLSNLLLPLVLPVTVLMMSGASVQVDAGSMFLTLSAVLVFPALAYAATRHREDVRKLSHDNGKWVSLFLVLLVIAVVTARQRAAIFEHVPLILLYTVLSTLLYAAGYAAGWRWPEAGARERMSLALASGVNNPALGISLALLYFPPDVGLFMVSTEISWGVVLTAFGWWIRRQHARAHA